MAIRARIHVFSGMTPQGKFASPIFVGPPTQTTDVAAAGVTNITADGRFIEIANTTGGDPFFALMQLDAASAQAGNAVAGSVLVRAGESRIFGVPHNKLASDYEIDIRAFA